MDHKRSSIGLVLLLGILPLLNGCAAVGLTMLGVGAGVATGTSVGYTLDGYAYRTFTAPLPQVESATRTALNKMGIKVDATAKTEQGKALAATGNDREIEVEFEIISSNATRMRTVAKQGIFFKDRATATEIILQTEKVLVMDATTANGRGARDTAKAAADGVKRVMKLGPEDEW
ncbi:MAG TPA: DUF3568 family protein [Candidatus Binatia bacterium]|nr:DUF3568 family protein [Candidatus Binatia bacterium]